MIGEIGQWWRPDFLVCEGSTMSLQPRVGGLLYEKTSPEGSGFVWGNIISFQPEKNLSYLAQIVPPWGGPAQSVVQVSLSDPKNGGEGKTTRLTLTDSLIGHLSDELLSGLDDGWRQLYGEGGLKSYLEQSEQPGGAR